MNNKNLDKVRGFFIIFSIVVLIEFLVIILLVYNNKHSATLGQRKFDESFIQYLNISCNDLQNVVQTKTSDIKFKSSFIALTLSDISSACSIVKYTSYYNQNPKLEGMLSNYKYVLTNASIDTIVENSNKFIPYMQDILKDANSKQSTDKFTDFLNRFQQNTLIPNK
ncbi:MAG: hypothetical protein Q8942_05515 [Bacillota bacterium]|nr:hypothetical protein [Bacillota bacterium]